MNKKIIEEKLDIILTREIMFLAQINKQFKYLMEKDINSYDFTNMNNIKKLINQLEKLEERKEIAEQTILNISEKDRKYILSQGGKI